VQRPALSRPLWVHPELVAAPSQPRRKIHLDYHNSQHVSRVGHEFDAQEFTRTLRDASVDSVVVFAKDMHGYFYFPSQHGPVHPGLAGRDLMGEQVAACQEAGIKVFLYYCVTWDNYLAESHPEWLSFTRERKTYLPTFDETPYWTALCLSNDDFVDLMLDHTREILGRCTPNGIWYDMPLPNLDVECFCANCLSALRRNNQDPLDVVAQRDRMQQLLIMWMARSKALIQELAPGVSVDQNNQTRLGLQDRTPFLKNVEIEALPTGEWGYDYFPVNSRYVRSLGVPGTGLTGRFMRAWADFGGLKSVHQLTLEAASIAAGGAAVAIGDQAPPSAKLDAGVYRHIGAAYGALVEVDEFLDRAVGAAEAAVYVSGLQLADIGREERHSSPVLRDGVSGLVKILTDLSVQCDVVEEGTVDLDRYRMLVLAEGVDFTPAAVTEIAGFVERGGILIHATSPGTPLVHTPWLSRLGVTAADPSPFTPSYVRLAPDFGDDYAGFDFALYEGVDRWALSGNHARVVAYLGEPAFQRAPEHYTSHAQTPFENLTESPVVLVRDRLAAFAFPIASAFFKHGYWVYREMFRRVLDEVYPERAIRSLGPSSLALSLTRQEGTPSHPGRWLLHAVNWAGATRPGPGHAEYYDDVVPQVGVRAEVRLPGAPKRVYDARSGQDLVFERVSDHVLIDLPQVKIHEVIVLEEGDE